MFDMVSYISLHFLENLKLNRLINVEYQHKMFHTHIATHFSLSDLQSEICILHADSQIVTLSVIFMHLEYKNDHTYFLAFTATAFLNYLKLSNKNKILLF